MEMEQHDVFVEAALCSITAQLNNTSSVPFR
jgi:hypothetical protein